MHHIDPDERAELEPILAIPGVLDFIGNTDWRTQTANDSALLRRLQEAERTPPKAQHH